MTSTKLPFLAKKPFVQTAKTSVKVSKEQITNKIEAKQPKNSLLKALVKNDNLTSTQNGAPTLVSSYSGLVDLFAMGGAIRGRTEADKVALFKNALKEDRLLAMKLLFHIRNIRSGLGERETFRVILKSLASTHKDLVVNNLSNIALFGRFDDYFHLFDTAAEQEMLEFIKNQLEADLVNYDLNKPISLLPKWLKSENTSCAESRRLATKTREFLGLNSRQYRKMLSALRAYSNVLEVKLCSNQWDKIEYPTVPSKANLVYRKAFSKHDPERYTAYIKSVQKGEVKMNAAALFPYEIIEKAISSSSEDPTLDAAWMSLPDYLKDNNRNILVVSDVSGSMNGRPIGISISLGLYIAERNKGAFNGYFISFSADPILHKVEGATLRQKIQSFGKGAGYNTDLQKVFTNLLAHAVKNKVPASEMPEQIIVISDMEFDNPQNGNTNFEGIEAQYNAAKYKMPNMVFWNAASKQNNIPVEYNQKGVLLVSGASPTVFTSLLSGKSVTPLDQVLATLNDKKYDCVVG